MITKPCVGVLFALCAVAASGVALAAPVECLQLKDGWARLPPSAAMKMTAGYGTIHNTCASAVTIIGARSAAFGDVSLHETTLQGDVSRMQHLHQPQHRGPLAVKLIDGHGRVLAYHAQAAEPAVLIVKGLGPTEANAVILRACPQLGGVGESLWCPQQREG